MTKSNMFKLVVVALTATALNACVKAEKRQDIDTGTGPAQRQFRLSKSKPVVDVTGYAENLLTSDNVSMKPRDTTSDTNTGTVTRRQYNFSMCGLADVRARNNSLLGAKLKVHSELELLESDLTVQNDGCVYWTASLPFNHFADAINLEINFVFLSQNAPKSYIHKRILLNPWDNVRGNNPEFLDITRNAVSRELNRNRWARGIDEVEAALAGTLSNTEKKLEISSVSIVPLQKNRQNYVSANNLGADAVNELVREEEVAVRRQMNRLQPLDIHLNMQLSGMKIRLKNSAGTPTDESLKMGRYIIHTQLIATDLDRRGHFIISDKRFHTSNTLWNTNTMGVSALIPLSVMIRPNWGNLQLAVKVTPFDIPGVQPFEALYTLGQFSDIGRSQSLAFDLSQYERSNGTGNLSFDYQKYIESAANYADWDAGLTERSIPDDGTGTLERGFPRFQFTLMNVLFSRIMPGDTATDRTIQYTVDTCLINNANGSKPGKGLKFEITTEDRGVPFKLVRETDHQGCLRWFGMISHKPYHRENLVRKVSHLKYLGSDMGRQEFDLDYYINPWDEKFTFGRDARSLPAEYLQQIAEAQKEAPPTRILITHFSYDAIGFRYAVDKFMNLTVKKSVLMNIDAKILKYNSIIWGRSGFSELRDGIYLLKIAMQKDYLDPTAPGRAISVNKRTGQRRLRTENTNDSETKQYLTVKEALVRVLGGKIVTPIEFDVTDLRTLRIRAQMFIQIETVDEKLLRLAVLLDERLTSMIGHNGADVTPQVLNELADQEKVRKELEVAQQAADQVQIRSLSDQIRLSEEKVKNLLKGLDRTTMTRVLDEMKRIRDMGETGVSNDRNRQYQAVNTALRATLQAIQNKIKQNIQAQTAQSVQSYEQTRTNECNRIAQRLRDEGREEEARLYDTTQSSNRRDGALCNLDLDEENRFYYLTSTVDIGSDRWLRSILTAEEYALFQNSSLRDDFTKPYMPNYDFDLLSNQGDEKEKDASGNEWGERVSGLPRRTFIGPITFVLNGNGSAMRPTDVLDESRCQGTCAVLNESEKSIVNNTNFMKDLREKMVRAFGNAVNDAYERSPYFGYVGHFYNKQVEDLIPMYRGLRSQYFQEMENLSQVGNLVEKMNFQYVTFADQEEPIRYLDQDCYKNWKSQVDATYHRWQRGNSAEERQYLIPNLPQSCLKPSERQVSKQAFLENINEKRAVTISMQDLKEFSKNGIMSEKLSLEKKRDVLIGLCSELTQQLAPKEQELDRYIEGHLGRFVIRGTAVPYIRNTILSKIRAIEENCQGLVRTFYRDAKAAVAGMGSVKDQNLKIATLARQLPMQVVRNARVLDTSNRYIYRDGKTLNYSVGTNFSLSNSFGVNRGMKLDPLESLEKLTGSIGGPVAAGINKVIGVAGGIANFGWAQNEAVSRSNGTSVSDGTTLSAQISTLDIELSEWEKCVTIRFDSKYYKEAIESLLRRDGVAVGYDTKFVSGIGYMMCSGDRDKVDDLNEGKQLRVRERYYYLTQIFNEGDMQDPQSLANHPWMLQIRGVRDFAIFQAALKKPERELNWWSMYGYARNDLVSMAQLGADQRHNDRSSMEVVNYEDEAKALQMMREAYTQSLPTFPGLYQFSDNSDDLVTDWPEVSR